MKLFALSIALLIAAPVFAAPYNLKDSSILGRYVLNPANKLSSIQSAELRFDADNALILTLSHTAESFVIEKTEDDGLIYDSSASECEEDCSDDVTRVHLIKGANGRPQLVIDIAWADTADADGKARDSVTYVLDWAATIPNAISFYRNIETNAQLDTAVAACSRIVKPAVSDGGPIFSEGDVCPTAISTVKFRSTIDEALPWYIKEMGSAKDVMATREIDKNALKNEFAAEEARIAGLNPKGKVKPATLVAAYRKVTDYLTGSSDRIFIREADGAKTIYFGNTRDSLILTLDINAQ